MSLLFDETDDHVAIADHAALALPDADWTIAGWMKPDSLAGTASQFILSWNHFNYLPSLNWWFREASHPSEPGKIKFRIKDDADQLEVMSPTAVITTTAWHHLCLVRAGDTFTQYVNAAAAGAATTSIIDAVDPSVAWLFGAVFGFDADSYLGGRLAEWAKWDRALSADERAALAAGLAPAFFPHGLSWHIPMCGDAVEQVAGLTTTIQGAVAAEHPPRIILPPPPRSMRGAPLHVHPAHVFRSPVVAGA
ncbi:MAG: LamG domain-containing protein [Pirellulales bacterium]|nr:LamG domain-containing protein [Pirellulales bacterium]